MQDNDPHHMHPDINYVYYFVILAVILVVVLIIGMTKQMNYLDSRYERKNPGKKDSETESEDDRDGQ